VSKTTLLTWDASASLERQMKRIFFMLAIFTLASSAFSAELRCKESINGTPIRAKAKKINLYEFNEQRELSYQTFSYSINNKFTPREDDKLKIEVRVQKKLPSNSMSIISVSLEQAKATSFEGSQTLGAELTMNDKSIRIECSIIKPRFN
jgi:hypothetical protein